MSKRLLAACALVALAAMPAAAQPRTQQRAAAPPPAQTQPVAPSVPRVERGTLVLENIPDTPPAIRERLRQYVNTRGANFQDFTPDGGVQ